MSKKLNPRAAEKRMKGKLSLHPLTLESALGAALQTGRATDQKLKKPVDKRRQNSRS